MTTHGSAAKAARERKEKHPDLYCPATRCLWRTGGGRCPRHAHFPGLATPMGPIAGLPSELADAIAREKERGTP